MKHRKLRSLLDHFLAASLLLAVSGIWLGKQVWQAGKSQILLLLLFTAAYFVCALGLVAWLRHERRHSPLTILLASIAAFGAAFMALVFVEWRWPSVFAGEMPRAAAFAILGIGLATLFLLNAAHGVLTGVARWVPTAILVAALGATLVMVRPARDRAPATEVAHLDTSLHVLRSTTYRGRFGASFGRGGAITAVDGGYLVANGTGALYFATGGGDAPLEVTELPYRVPINPEAFSSAGRKLFGDAWTDHLHQERLRVADVVAQPMPDDGLRIFVSHHYWKPDETCFVVRVSVLQGRRPELFRDPEAARWRTLYESSPCLGLNTEGPRGGRFGGYQIGGAMALLDEDELLVAVGDHEYDGWNRAESFPQDPANPYGKLLSIDLESGAATIYSLGHRNPQGLFVDVSGRVWATEHGPRGGDELNLVTRDGNYGWPAVTYGTEYSLHHWPMNEAAGRHDGFEKPMLAFVPSIALSSLTGIQRDLFPAWRGDLLLTALSGELRRVRIDDGRAVVVEPIAVTGRVRDVAEGGDGRIALWTDAQSLTLLEPADTNAPAALVFQCVGCHTLNKWEASSIGPNLWQVVGRKVASEPHFDYSQALEDHGGRWTRERLDEYLANPSAAVPGTTMQFPGIADPDERRELIRYLGRLR